MYPDGFQWDEIKNQTNIEKHGIDFVDAVTIFERATLEALDDRRNYGEDRYNAIGLIDDGTIIHVTYTERDGDIRIISARCASQKEREAYLELMQELEVLQEQECDQAEEAERQALEAVEEKERQRREVLDRELERALQSLKERQNDQGRNR